MREKLEFIGLNKRNYFIHSHSPLQTNRETIIFFNPMFDEKKRVQKFQCETARALCRLGYTVIRFDYYGTGDSGGDTFEFDFSTVYSDFSYLIDHIKNTFSPEGIILFGIRLGADLALMNSISEPTIKHLILVEPIIDGKRYLLELRMRKKLFYNLNKIQSNKEQLLIQEQKFEDFQGYPMSFENLAYLEKMNLSDSNIIDKSVTIFKTNSISNKKLVVKFKEKIEIKKSSSVNIHYVDCPEFWAALESVDTSTLTQQIITFISNN